MKIQRSYKVRNSLLKWQKTIVISFSKFFAYRLDFLLTIIAPSLVAFFIKYHFWTSIYSHHPNNEINGYNLEQMISYHIWALIIALISQGNSALNLAIEIRHGKISSYLLYPFNFWEFHTASFLAFETIQIGIALITLGVLSLIQVIPLPSLELLSLGFAYCLLISVFWFSLQFLTGILSFWLEETWGLRVLIQIIVSFLSGFIIPLEFFPSWLSSILEYTPFPFMSYHPIRIFMGEGAPWEKGLFILSFWTIVVIAINIFTWNRGIRNYTAAGM